MRKAPFAFKHVFVGCGWVQCSFLWPPSLFFEVFWLHKTKSKSTLLVVLGNAFVVFASVVLANCPPEKDQSIALPTTMLRPFFGGLGSLTSSFIPGLSKPLLFFWNLGFSFRRRNGVLLGLEIAKREAQARVLGLKDWASGALHVFFWEQFLKIEHEQTNNF